MKSRLAAVILLGSMWGCSSQINVPALTATDIPRMESAGNFPDRVYRIEPGDTLEIVYTFHSEMNQQALVRPDGKIAAREVGEISVAGLATEELERFLVQKTSDRLRQPEVVVSIVQYAERTVYVGGEVGKPGTVPYRKNLTPLQAILSAGGLRNTARADSVILIRSSGPSSEFVSRKLDLAKAITDGSPEPLYLAPHDVVYIPKSPIANANLWVRQHLTDLIPFINGAGASYRLGAP